MDTNGPYLKRPTWPFAISGLFAVSAAGLFVGKVFYAWPIDAVAVVLFLVIWIPAVLPLLRKLKYKDLIIEFMEDNVKQVQADVANLANQTEIEREEQKLSINVDPRKIRLRYTSERADETYFRVKVWLDAPKDFMTHVQKVVFERHPTFKNRIKEVDCQPFEDRFRCWGEFTIRALITLRDGQTLRRQKFIALDNGQEGASEGVESVATEE